MTLTPHRLAQIKARADAATPGPWLPAVAPHTDDNVTKAQWLADTLDPDVDRPLYVTWAETDREDLSYIVPAVTGDGPRSSDNAEFIAAARTDVPDLLHEIDRLRAANDQLAQLLADRDQREDTLNDDIAALQAENQAWQSYATWSCTRDGATYPCGDCDGCRAGVWNSQAANAALRARIDAARALCEPSEWSVLDPRRERLLRALNGEGATDE